MDFKWICAAVGVGKYDSYMTHITMPSFQKQLESMDQANDYVRAQCVCVCVCVCA